MWACVGGTLERRASGVSNGKEFGENSILKTEIGNKQKNVTMARNEMTPYQVCEWSAVGLTRKSHKNSSCLVWVFRFCNWKIFEYVSKW